MTIRDGWYIPAPDPRGRLRKPRNVLRVTDMAVYYGMGDDKHRFCQRKTFERWMLIRLRPNSFTDNQRPEHE